ncbi:MAG TPA: cyclase family protein [Anaerolineae bacterium]|nr:cyclase family protein [Anaerolineae bacterium]
MTIHDLTVPLHNGMPFYPGDPAPQFTRLQEHTRGDEWTVTHLSMSAHTGTHVDAPLHRFQNGATVDSLNLRDLIGRAYVVDLSNVVSEITANDLIARNIPRNTKRLILKTRNAELWQRDDFQINYVALSGDGAQWLVGRGIRLVAFDYLSADIYATQKYPAHNILLGAGVVIVEGVMLGGIAEGWYVLICLPLRIQVAEGAPARAVLLSGTSLFDYEEE